MQNTFQSGFIAIVGRPNVGKSTLLNAMVGQKLAIVSARPQTTRSRIMGVCGGEHHQMVFVDTPGIHTPRTKLGETMMRTVQGALDGIDVLLVMLDATAIGDHDRSIARDMAQKKTPKLLVINKIDLVEPKRLLSVIAQFAELSYDAVLPVSAQKGEGLDALKSEIIKRLPAGPKYFPDDMLTDQPERVLCAELIREKALLHLRDEVPHGVGVEMMAIKKESSGLVDITADIYCERDSHKGIIIGKSGAMLRQIGTEARQDIERLLGARVNLRLFVRVRPNWRDSTEDLRTLGYFD